MQTSTGENPDFKEIVNATNSIDTLSEQEFDLTSKASSFTKNDEKIREINRNISGATQNITLKETEIQNIINGNTPGSLTNAMKQLNKYENEKADLEKEKTKLEKIPAQIKVNAFFTDDEEGSNTNKTFTYRDGELS